MAEKELALKIYTLYFQHRKDAAYMLHRAKNVRNVADLVNYISIAHQGPEYTIEFLFTLILHLNGINKRYRYCADYVFSDVYQQTLDHEHLFVENNNA